MKPAIDASSPLPIQRRNTITGATPSPLASVRATPTGSYRLSPDGAIISEQRHRWADATPTPSGEDKHPRLLRKGSMETPSMLWPATPSPMASPVRYAAPFGMPLPGVPETTTVSQAPPLQMQQVQQVQQLQQVQQVQQAPMQTQTQPAGQGAAPAQLTPGQPAPAQGAQMIWVQMGPNQAPMQAMVMAAPMQMAPVQVAAPAVTTVAAVPAPGNGVACGAGAPAGIATQLSDVGSEIPEQLQDVTHLAGRQLFQEALDASILDGHHPQQSPLPSPGSAAHGTGRCNPCAWFWKPKGCQNASNCAYCHLCPEGELKSRKKAKVAALRMGAIEPVDQSKGQGNQPAALKLTSLI